MVTDIRIEVTSRAGGGKLVFTKGEHESLWGVLDVFYVDLGGIHM
jgi:hypothetical protein